MSQQQEDLSVNLAIRVAPSIEATTRMTAAMNACPWLSHDEASRVPGWLLDYLASDDLGSLRSLSSMMSDRYLMSLVARRISDLESQNTRTEGA